MDLVEEFEKEIRDEEVWWVEKKKEKLRAVEIKSRGRKAQKEQVVKKVYSKNFV